MVRNECQLPSNSLFEKKGEEPLLSANSFIFMADDVKEKY